MSTAAPPHEPLQPAAPSRVRHYEEMELTFWGDPLLTGARLVEAGLSETYVLYERGGRWSVGFGVLAEIVVDRQHVVQTDAAGGCSTVPWQGDPLEAVTEALAALPVSGWRAYGWAAFELAYSCAGLGELVPGEKLLHLVVPHTDVRLEFGHAIVRSTDPGMLRKVAHLLSTPALPRLYPVVPLDVDRAGIDEYRDAVTAAIQEIRDGGLQKVILSRVVPVEHPVDLIATYVVGRRRNTPARSFLMSMGGLRACGFSPEIVVEVDEGGRVTTQPLAGTRALAGTTEEDHRLRCDLLRDSKEIFEHSISVKLAYDELAELCQPGSVTVDAFMTVKERGSVQHLASSVSGQLEPGHGPWRAFAALFPAVTVSGVPKRAAYASIRRHEAEPRGLYGGAVLTVDHNGALDAALVLRSIFQRAGRTWLRAGAGIVEQSHPDREFEETCEKLRSVTRHIVRGAASPAAG